MTAGAAGGAPEPPNAVFDAVVLAGGAARRLGGADKPGLRVGGRALVDRVLDACAGARTTVVVGEARATVRPVLVTRESPSGSGPLAALAAGLHALPRPAADHVVVLSADLPFLGRDTVRRLLRALGDGAEAAVLTDPGGRDQPLVAAYRAAPLRAALAGIARAHDGTCANLPLRLLTERLVLDRIRDPAAASASFDCDTWEDLAAARARIREHGHVLDEWITAVKAELGIDLDVDTALLLDLARDAAHGVARPAAPLTTFLVGYAAGLSRDAGPEAIAEATRKAVALAARWAEEAAEPAGPTTPAQDAPGDGPDARPDAR
ncbi:NTP transferase domain-containing protein [Streptomyces sp. NPDC060194]|uniref:NTP transferase domain-containing protein n=1 Tax=Streptomyces sp. NPDC060194 TaxID=3347069 RepID=UPI003656D60F